MTPEPRSQMFEYEDEEDRSFIQRNRGVVLIAVILVIGGGVFYAARALSGGHKSAPRQDDMMMVSLPPPPPPPPKLQPTPPPQQQPTPEQQQDQKMVEQQPVQDEKKSEAPKDKEKPDAPAPLGTSITGPGPGADLGLGSGLGGGGGYGSGGPGGTKYGWYASEVQNRISDALRSNPATRRSTMNVTVRIWPDASGTIIKARVIGGDPTLDATLQNNILTGMRLADPPPADMPLPIVMRVSAQRPQ